MIITKFPHAGMIISAEDTKIICDPLLPGSLIDSIFSLPKGFSLSKAALEKMHFDGILLSHHHNDHFHLPSLNHFRRDCKIFYPEGNPLLERHLAKMGFKDVVPILPNKAFKIGAIEIVPTISRVPFAEVGFIFRYKGVQAWNTVDSNPNEQDIKSYRKKYGRMDLVFSFYQSLDEPRFLRANLNGKFPVELYQRNLDLVRQVYPKYVCPSSSDLLHASEAWVNAHMFIISKKRFLSDIQRSDSSIKGLLLEAGESIQIKKSGIKKISTPWAYLKITKARALETEWRPDVGLPPVKDHNPQRKKVGLLKKEANQFLDGIFQKLLLEASKRKKFQIFKKDHVTWKIRVVLPDKKELVRILDFARNATKWVPAERLKDERYESCDLETIIGAGVLLAHAQGEIDAYALSIGGYSRLVDRYFRVDDWIVRAGLDSNRDYTCIASLVLNKLYSAAREVYVLSKVKTH